MSKLVLSPYPRFHTAAVKWGSWSVSIDDRSIAIEDVADQTDAQSVLTFTSTVTVASAQLEDLDIPWAGVELVLTASSNSTAFTAIKSVTLSKSDDSCSATASVTVPGDSIAENLLLRAQIITKSNEVPWLARRILSEAPIERVALHSDQVGFPTVSYSFDEAGLPDAPWRLVIEADEAEASFMHSVRLELNEDFPLVCDYLDGKNVPHISSHVTAFIVRILVGTVARLAVADSEGRTPDDIAVAAPNSIAASAARATRQYLNHSLNWAVEKYQTRPEVFEMSLASGTGIARGN